MKKSTYVIIAVVAGIIVVNYLSKKDKTSSDGAPPEAESVKGVWPPASADEQPVAMAPNLTAKNYYIVFDGSGSMLDPDCADGSNKSEVAKKAVGDFSKSIPKDANLGLLVFDTQGITERVPLGTENREVFTEQVNIVSPGGSTPLRSAITQAVAQLTEQGRRQFGYGEYHLVVVTDGEANPNSENPASIVAQTLESSPIVIHTIGFCIGETHSLNQKGRTIYHPANNPGELAQGLKEVLAESEQFDVKAFQ
jgi:Mg-chelatase subunit ChlD